MYELSVTRDFIAQHYLIGGDWGCENRKHSHHFKAEFLMTSSELNQHDYIYDISEIHTRFNKVTTYFADQNLNDLEEFKDKNPSIENFARIFLERFIHGMDLTHIHTVAIRLWEDESAWASFQKKL